MVTNETCQNSIMILTAGPNIQCITISDYYEALFMKYGIKYLLENNKTFLACGIRYGFIVRFYYFNFFSALNLNVYY